MANVDQIQTMVHGVKVNGKDVYVVVQNIKQFKNDVVEQLTVRENKRRTFENRFNWLLKNFIRQNYEMKGKHMKVHLLSGTDREGLFRDERGHFVKQDLGLPAIVKATEVAAPAETAKAPAQQEVAQTSENLEAAAA